MPPDTSRKPESSSTLREQWHEQVLRTRQLLEGQEDEAAEGLLAPLGGHAEVEARILAELASATPLADPEHFPTAHRRVMHALEVLDREGGSNPRVPNSGPLTPLVELAVENVAGYIVSNYTDDVTDTLRTLYARRMVQCEPQAPERALLSAARDEAVLVAPSYGEGGPLLRLLIGGAAVPVLGWIAEAVGVLDISNRWVWLGAIGVLTVLFIAVSWVMLQGAAMAHRRSRLIMQTPLADLWQTIGHCGDPPEDDSRTFAMLVIVLTALVWFVLPAITAVVLLLW